MRAWWQQALSLLPVEFHFSSGRKLPSDLEWLWAMTFHGLARAALEASCSVWSLLTMASSLECTDLVKQGARRAACPATADRG
jgi:hypothetical protein